MPYRLKKSSKLGLPPGVSRYSGDISDEEITIDIVNYQYRNIEEVVHQQSVTKDEIQQHLEYISDHNITWIDIQGIHDENLIKTLADHFNFHPILTEDLLSPLQRPKVDIYEDHIVFFLRRVFDDSTTLNLETDQIAIVLGKNYVLSFNELNDDKFKKVKQMINNHITLFTKHKNDFLAYILLDYVIDTYFLETERIEEEIERIEDLILMHKFDSITESINYLKKRNIGLRKIILPLREFTPKLERRETTMFSDTTKPFLTDLNDHIYQLIDMVEDNQLLISNLKENYSSEMSTKMNEIMMILTVVSTILLPLTFITSLYGMNFSNMPELSWKYGYAATWMVMIVISLTLSIIFRRKNLL